MQNSEMVRDVENDDSTLSSTAKAPAPLPDQGEAPEMARVVEDDVSIQPSTAKAPAPRPAQGEAPTPLPAQGEDQHLTNWDQQVLGGRN